LKKFGWISWLIALALIASGTPARAQEAPPGAVVVVQAGDSLAEIARRFGVSINALMQANGIQDANLIGEGAELLIPGLDGVQGYLSSADVAFGEDLLSLSRRYRLHIEMLVRLNRLTSPEELYAGAPLVILDNGQPAPALPRAVLAPGETLLELSARQGVNTWAMANASLLAAPAHALPGDLLALPAVEEEAAGAPAAAILAAEIAPLPFKQGKTSLILLQGAAGMTLEGEFLGLPLHFFYDPTLGYVALQGAHAMTEAGLYPLTLRGALPGGASFAISQWVGVRDVRYPYDRPLTVNPETIDPAVTGPENEQWAALTAPATAERYWQGVFQIPSRLPGDYCLESGDCWSSRFGNRRSYNGGPYSSFHTGLDIVGKVGAEILAPAPGVVVFAGPLTVRGNATVIDHGWGVYSAYLHQSEFSVQVGERVETGQVIGLVGATGRVEGPHLHWEVWAGGVQVDPLEWLSQEFP
jgi:murein DD-endopeptidase MepM/ murein hydrolase activator NlpD